MTSITTFDELIECILLVSTPLILLVVGLNEQKFLEGGELER
jgi:hypothetical protein